jgi:hypothetical protein
LAGSDAECGESLVAKVKELEHEANIRRIIIENNEEGKTLIEIPLALGVVGALLLPVLAAVGAIAALVADCTIVVVLVHGAENLSKTSERYMIEDA